MTNRTRALLWLLALIACIAVGYLINRQIIWKEETFDIGYTEAAQKNQFLAAHDFLQRQGVNAQTLRSFSVLDNLSWQGEALTADDTLIFLNAHKVLHGDRIQKLLAWIERGGTVIVSTDNSFMGSSENSQDLLLEHLNVEVLEWPEDEEDEAEDDDAFDFDIEDYIEDDYYEDDESSEDDEDWVNYLDEDSTASESEPASANHQNVSHSRFRRPSIKYTETSADSGEDETEKNSLADSEKEPEETEIEKELRTRCDDYNTPYDTKLPQETTALKIDYDNGARFNYYGDGEPNFSNGDDDGLYLARFFVGQGNVVVASDNGFWTNRRIDCHDHAYLLWKLINPNGKVWFVVNQDAPSLWRLIWQASPYGALAAFAALALWLWANAVRFGPVLTRPSGGRRSLAEHIHASAMLLWRRQQHPYLVTLLRNELQQQLVRHAHLFNEWSRAEQISYVQTLTTLSASEIEQALFSEKLQSPQDFTEAVALLQTIRKSI